MPSPLIVMSQAVRSSARFSRDAARLLPARLRRDPAEDLGGDVRLQPEQRRAAGIIETSWVSSPSRTARRHQRSRRAAACSPAHRSRSLRRADAKARVGFDGTSVRDGIGDHRHDESFEISSSTMPSRDGLGFPLVSNSDAADAARPSWSPRSPPSASAKLRRWSSNEFSLARQPEALPVHGWDRPFGIRHHRPGLVEQLIRLLSMESEQAADQIDLMTSSRGTMRCRFSTSVRRKRERPAARRPSAALAAQLVAVHVLRTIDEIDHGKA